jgi:tetratricopeptide (TPR) repeat protein
MNDAPRISPQILRGLQLKDLGRYADAERAFKEALAQEPNDAFALHQLAACQFHQAGRQREALATVDASIAIEPNSADHHILRSFILSHLNRPKEALEASRTALSLEPLHSGAFTAAAQAHLHSENWVEAEDAARQALELDADNSAAANQLAQALRLQNKLAENASHLAGMLARDPEDPYTHASAGWAALQRGERRAAEVHFREALRLSPGFESAREGLLTSFRSRSPLYRAYLRYCFAMQRIGKGRQWAIIIGAYVAMKLGSQIKGGVGSAVCVIYFLFVLWVWVAKAAGNFLLLFDSFARHALRRNEKIEAAVVGGGLIVGLAAFGSGLVFDWSLAQYLGIGCIASIFPLSMTFTNGSPVGRWLFGTVGTLALLGGFLALGGRSIPFTYQDSAKNLFFFVVICSVASTWLGNVRALRRPME